MRRLVENMKRSREEHGGAQRSTEEQGKKPSDRQEFCSSLFQAGKV